jgi:predicted transcriptional regulator YdeE
LHIAGLRFTPETRNQIAALWKQYIPRLATLSSRVGRNAPAPAHAHVPDFFERYSEEFNAQTGTAGMEVWVSVKS